MTNNDSMTAEARETCAKVLDLIEQYTRPDFYMWLLHDHAGQKSDPYKRATEAKELLTKLLNSTPSNRAAVPETPVGGEAQTCVKRDDAVRRAKDWLNQYQLDRHYEGMERVFQHVAQIVQDLLPVSAHAQLGDGMPMMVQARALADAVNTDYQLDDGSYVEDELRHEPLSKFVVDTLLDLVRQVCQFTPLAAAGDDEGEK